MKNITLLIIILCAVTLRVTAQDVRVHDEDFATYGDVLALDTTKVEKKIPDTYFRILFLKLRHGKENNIYKPIIKSRSDRYELLDKGSGYVGVVLGFGKKTTDNLMLEPIVDISNVYSTKLDLELSGAYFVGKNMALGGRLGYALSDTRIDMSSPIFELLLNTKDLSLNGITTTLSAGVFVKNFIPLDPDKRIFIVNETRLGYAYKYTLSRDKYKNGDLIHKTEQKQHMVSLGITPGLMYFLTRNLSVEFLISPVLAFYEHTTVTNDEIETGKVNGGGLNFIVSPIRMNFGISYFFGLNYKQ
ncbi:MAG: hypothetical protein RRZ64_07535 [Rikenellaceae bacterium]